MRGFNLRVTLAYLPASKDHAGEIARIKRLFPPILLRGGRFFLLPISESDRGEDYYLGIEAVDFDALRALVQYLEDNGIHYRMGA